MLSSLKSKVLISFVMLVILPVMIGAYLIMNQVKSSQIARLDIIHTQMVKRVSSELQTYVTHNKQILENSFNTIGVDNYSEATVSKEILRMIYSNSNYDMIMFVDKNRHTLAHMHRYYINNHDQENIYLNTAAYEYTLKHNDFYFGEVAFMEETSEPVALMAFPIRDNNTNSLIGTVLASLRLKPVWNLLGNINTQQEHQIYILDSNGKLIAHPNPSMVLKDINMTITKQGITTGLSGDAVYLKSEKVKVGNTYFTIVSEQSTVQAMQLYRSVTTVIIIVALLTILMCILLIRISIRRIVDPINNLAATAKEIEAGNLDKTAEVSGSDEIAALAKSFNKMTAKLKENNTQLKEFNLGLQKKISSELEKTRKMEQMLFEQKKFADMGQMINAIAHQWRQPLNNIGLIQQYLADGFKTSTITQQEYDEYSESLIEIVQNMSGTIDDFRTFFTTTKQKERFNIVHALKEFLKLSGAQLQSNSIRYRIQCFVCDNRHIFDIDEISTICNNKELEILGHSGEFKQVLQNIVSNAMDEFKENNVQDPLLTISLNATEDSVIITFEDNAGGIPEDIIQNIFDPYFTTKDEGKGTGIGLYISKLIIDDHFGGILTASNTDLGAEFKIMIPKAG